MVWETRFKALNEELKLCKVTKKNRRKLLNFYFNILNESRSFNYEWIARSVQTKLEKMVI